MNVASSVDTAKSGIFVAVFHKSFCEQPEQGWGADSGVTDAQGLFLQVQKHQKPGICLTDVSVLSTGRPQRHRSAQARELASDIRK